MNKQNSNYFEYEGAHWAHYRNRHDKGEDKLDNEMYKERLQGERREEDLGTMFAN